MPTTARPSHSYFAGLLRRRPRGPDGGPAFPRRLRRNPRRRSGLSLDRSADQRGHTPRLLPSTRKLHPILQTSRHQLRRARRLRRLDGVKDGILNDPRTCHFDPSVLLCKGADSDSCLTAPQITALNSLYAGAITRRRSDLPRLHAWRETGPSGWSLDHRLDTRRQPHVCLRHRLLRQHGVRKTRIGTTKPSTSMTA